MIAIRLIIGGLGLILYCNQTVAMMSKEQEIAEQPQHDLLKYEQWGPHEAPLSRLAALELDARAFKEDFKEKSLQFPHLAQLTTLKLLYYCLGELMIMEKPVVLSGIWKKPNVVKKLVVPFPSLESLTINHAGLVTLFLYPSRLQDFPHLARLDLRYNKLSYVPALAASDKRMPVSYLDCSHNEIHDLGAVIIQRIKTVLLAHNKLSIGFLYVGEYDCCEELDLSHNRFLEVGINSYNLRKLALNNVDLRSIAITCYSLQELSLKNNKLAWDILVLPDGRFAILNKESIDPAWTCPNVSMYVLHGNTIKIISPEEWEQRFRVLHN